jgi:hypothetical protein
MGAIKRSVDKTARAAARVAAKGRSYADRLREARRRYEEKRDLLDMDHLHVMLGFWLTADSNSSTSERIAGTCWR